MQHWKVEHFASAATELWAFMLRQGKGWCSGQLLQLHTAMLYCCVCTPQRGVLPVVGNAAELSHAQWHAV